jgi:hypothetical protein
VVYRPFPAQSRVSSHIRYHIVAFPPCGNGLLAQNSNVTPSCKVRMPPCCARCGEVRVLAVTEHAPGIILRRHDTPQSVKRTRRELIEKLAEAATRSEQVARLPQLLQIITRELDRLRSAQVPLHDLVLTYHLSRDPAEYQTDTLNATVARELAGRGVTLNPGESVRYVITEYQADVPSDRARAWEFIDGSWGYDVARYTELLMRAVETVFVPFGVSASICGHVWRHSRRVATSDRSLNSRSRWVRAAIRSYKVSGFRGWQAY